jgi:hypothetical protein
MSQLKAQVRKDGQRSMVTFAKKSCEIQKATQ